MFVRNCNIIPSIKSYSKRQILLKSLFSYEYVSLDKCLQKTGKKNATSFMPFKDKEIRNYRKFMILMLWNRHSKLMENSVK